MRKRFKKPKPIKKVKPPLAPMAIGDIVEVAGFRDFWQTSHDTFPDFYRCVGRLTDLINKFRNAPGQGAMEARVIHSMVGLAGNSFGALIVLGLNGYGHDAMRITRSMFETLVNAKWIKLHPTEAQDYVDFTWVRKWETYEYFRQYAPQDIPAVPEDKVNELMAQVARVRPRFENRNGQLRKTWCSTPFRTCCEAVGLGQYYPTFYAQASDLQHGNIQALVAQAEDELTIKPAPSLGSLDVALRIGHLSVLGVFDVFNDIAALGFEADLRAAMEDFNKAWQH
jgi:hypothetical protein